MIKKTIKKIIPDSWRYEIVERKYNNRPEGIIRDWEEAGCPIPPPPPVKQKIVRDYQKKYGYNVLVETGTYLGYMVSSQRKVFKTIYSIEISDQLYHRARRKFKKYDSIHLFLGDSGDKMPEVISQINEPAIFWLDGHYSAGITSKGELNCPIWKELDAIFTKDFPHVILIDDARDFTGNNDYPTIDELEDYFHKKNPAYNLKIKDDVIRVVID